MALANIHHLNHLAIIMAAKSASLKETILQFSQIYNPLTCVKIILVLIPKFIINFLFFWFVKNMIKIYIAPYLNYLKKNNKKIIWIITVLIMAVVVFILIFYFLIFLYENFNIFNTVYADSKKEFIVGFKMEINGEVTNVAVQGSLVDHLVKKFGNRYGFIASMKTAGFLIGNVLDNNMITSDYNLNNLNGILQFKRTGAGSILGYKIENQFDPSANTSNEQGLSVKLFRVLYFNYKQDDLPKVPSRSSKYKYERFEVNEENPKMIMFMHHYKDGTVGPFNRVLNRRNSDRNFPDTKIISNYDSSTMNNSSGIIMDINDLTFII